MGVPKVSVHLDGHSVWVDIFHRLAEASFHLLTGDVNTVRSNPLLAGMLHYRSDQGLTLLVDALGGDLLAGVGIIDCCRSLGHIQGVVTGVAAGVIYHLVLQLQGSFGLIHCRLTNHATEGLSTGRAEVLQRTTCHGLLLRRSVYVTPVAAEVLKRGGCNCSWHFISVVLIHFWIVFHFTFGMRDVHE